MPSSSQPFHVATSGPTAPSLTATVPHTTQPTSATRSTPYAMPLAPMWQNVGEGWLASRQQAANTEDVRHSSKKAILESRQTKEIQITTISWLAENIESIVLLLVVPSFPNFHICDHPKLVELLGITPTTRIDTYDPLEDHWMFHAMDTVRVVERDSVLLFRALPGGITGPRMDINACPNMKEEMAQLCRSGARSKRKHPSSPSKAGPSFMLFDDGDEEVATPSRKRIRSQPTAASDTPDDPFSSLVLTPITPLRSLSPHAITANSPTINAVDQHRKIILYLAIDHVEVGGGHGPDIIDGFERIERLTSQQMPRISQPDAFKMVFGLDFKKSMFHSTYRLFYGNKAYIEKLKDIIVIEDSDDGNGSDESLAPRSSSHPPISGKSSSCTSLLPMLSPPVTFACLSSIDEEQMLDSAKPENPSDRLLRHRTALDRISSPDAGPHSLNPGHREIRPATRAAAMCALHHFETSTFHLTAERRWPQVIDFARMEERVWELQPMLEELVEDPSPSHFYQFLMSLSKRLGLLNTLGSGGHYEFSSKYGLGTGYYREKGYMVISRALHHMFPIRKVQEVETIPMLKFISRVLVPEVVTYLIEDDRRETPMEATKTLEDSWVYGEEMFNYIDDDEVDVDSESLVAQRKAVKGKEKASPEWVDLRDSEFSESNVENT
ncbi:hypothetical protein D9615_003176 [Tricholomella constricta]|uniref:Restriction of telomere capping protein 4 n=1 Tax=Tricholomella constricta TaxID=117010 RepID=A0A8H5HJ91_9AGAR|nr:hypothetical protein D9615_003176 [Tricholomella constricta]